MFFFEWGYGIDLLRVMMFWLRYDCLYYSLKLYILISWDVADILVTANISCIACLLNNFVCVFIIPCPVCQQTDEGEDDLKKGTQLLEIYALEIQMYTAQKNNKKLKVKLWFICHVKWIQLIIIKSHLQWKYPEMWSLQNFCVCSITYT